VTHENMVRLRKRRVRHLEQDCRTSTERSVQDGKTNVTQAIEVTNANRQQRDHAASEYQDAFVQVLEHIMLEERIRSKLAIDCGGSVKSVIKPCAWRKVGVSKPMTDSCPPRRRLLLVIVPH